MSFFPVVQRHLRALSRKWLTYWGRTLTGTALTMLAFMIVWDDYWRPTAVIGRSIFMALGGTFFVSALIAGVASTADSISSEKRDGTLGLLFLTDLKGFDVVIGKLVSNGIVGLYMLGAGLPVMALPVMMGGVTGNQVWQMALVILNGMFFGLCVGLFVSVISRTARTAMVAGVGIVLWFTVGILAVEALVHELLGLRYGEPIWGRIGPSVGFVEALGIRGVATTSVLYWHSFASTHVLAWMFLLFAAVKIRTAWQERAPTVRQIKLRDRLKLWSVGRADERRAYRTRLLGVNPICWLDDRYRLQKSVLWGLFLTGLTFWMWMFSLYPSDLLDDEAVLLMILFSQPAILSWMAFTATSRLAEDKQSGALELLLSTPFSTGEIIQGRLLALRRQFGWLSLCLFLFYALTYGGMLYFYRGWSHDYVPFMVTMAILGLTVFTLYQRGIAITGQWFALVAPNGLVAGVMTLVLVVGLHWAMFAGLMLSYSIIDHKVMRLPNLDEWAVLPLWAALGIGNSIYWSRWAGRNLEHHFRLIAGRLPMKSNFLERIASRFGWARALQIILKGG